MTDAASTENMCNMTQNNNVSAQPSERTKKDNSNIAFDEQKNTGSECDGTKNESQSDTNKTALTDNTNSRKGKKRKNPKSPLTQLRKNKPRIVKKTKRNRWTFSLMTLVMCN